MRKYPSPRIEKFTSLKEFLNSQFTELLPNQDIIIKHHLNLVDYLESETPLFILRKFKNHSNRGNVYSFEEHSFTVSDNEPALWVFMETFYQSELDFLDLIENQRFPIAFAIKKEEKLGNIWKTIGRKHKDFSANGWKHCHIFQCSPLRETIANKNDLKRRSLRLLSPLNHFPFFSPRKYLMPIDYGEDKECIECVIWWLYNHFYSEKNKNTFKNFVEIQGFAIPIREPKDIKIDYSIKEKSNAKFSKLMITSKIKNKKIHPTDKRENMNPPKIIDNYIQKMKRQLPLTKKSELKDLFIKWSETSESTIGDMHGRKSNPEAWLWIEIDNNLYKIHADTKRKGVVKFLENEEKENPWILIPTGKSRKLTKFTNDINGNPIPGFYMYKVS
jgi:hypothetical protein